jgi:hypothetical protein
MVVPDAAIISIAQPSAQVPHHYLETHASQRISGDARS